MMATRWGIASAGKISFDFVNAIQVLPQSEHEVVAVAARSLERAQEFATKFNIPHAHGSYEELAQRTDIDCVYIGTIHTQHYALSQLFMNAGKHVVCEKPMSMNSRQCKETLDLAKQQNVFFLEGFWSRFFPVYNDLRRDLDSGLIGDVRVVQANFGDNVLGCMDIERIENKSLGGGTLLDIGCYPLQFAQFIFKGEQPVNITSSARFNKNGVDESVVTTLTYSDNRFAVLTCCFTCDLDQTASIYGTKGHIKLPNFWNPERVETPSGKYEYKLPQAKYPMIFRRGEGLVYEIQEVRQCLLKGLKESPKMTHAESLQICQISDEIRKQCGILYDEDKLTG